MIKLMLQFNGKNFTFPINPEKLSISTKIDNEEMNIIGLGKAITKGTPGLEQFSLESFFPGPNSYFYTGVKPLSCINFIEEIIKADNINNNVAKFVTLGLPKDLSMYVVINNFTYDHKAGEEEDIYFKLELTKYVPYGVKTVNVELTGLASTRAKSTNIPATTTTTNSTYTVESGDCLWNITKACCGDGSKWQELYNLNKAVIGNNPNLIKAGQVLTLPSGWELSGKVTKLQNTTTKTASIDTSTYAPVVTNDSYQSNFSAGGGSGGGRWRTAAVEVAGGGSW